MTVSLKFLLEQRITTAPQQQWISKLLGFDFRVEYCPGSTNTVANEEVMSSLCAISIPHIAWLDDLRSELFGRQELQQCITKVQEGKALDPWEFRDDVLWYKNKLFIPPGSPLTATIISFIHNSCHEGY